MSSDGSSDEPNMIRIKSDLFTSSNVPLLNSELLSDIVFICGDDFIPIKSHKLVLRNWSSFFSKIVECSLSIQGPFPITPLITLKEVPSKDLHDILKFIYTGDMMIEESRLSSIIKTARFLEVNKLPEQLEAYETVHSSSLSESVDTSPPSTEPATTNCVQSTQTQLPSLFQSQSQSPSQPQSPVLQSQSPSPTESNTTINKKHSSNYLGGIRTSSGRFGKVDYEKESDYSYMKNDRCKTTANETIDLTTDQEED